MSSASEGAAPARRRLHPAAMAVWPLQQAVGLVVFFVFGTASRLGALLFVGALIVSVGAAVARWRRFTWGLDGGTLVIEQGLLQRSRRVIPADRVQSVDFVRPLRHRVFGVVQVRVEAIGGDRTEGLLEALSPTDATALQHALLGARAVARARHAGEGAGAGAGADGRAAADVAGEAAEDVVDRDRSRPRVLTRVTPRSLVVAGLTGGRVGVVAVIFGGAQELLGDRIEDVAGAVPTNLGLVVYALVAAAGLAAIFLVSVVATVVTYWNFTISRDADELRIARGLIEQRLQTVPLRRIQSLRIEQNAVRRVFGLASVKADLAGRSGGDDTTSGLLLPAAPRADAEALIADLLGTAGPVRAELRPAPRRARRRYLVRGLAATAVAGLVAGGATLTVGGPAWVPLAVLVAVAVVAIPLALGTWAALGSAEVDGVLVARTGVVVRRRVHVPVARVQTMTSSASPFQRRRGLADVEVGIARSGGWGGARLPELDASEALALMARTTHAAVDASRRSSPDRRPAVK